MNRLSAALARGSYSILLRCLLPAYLLRLWWRGRAEPAYRHALGERCGYYTAVAPHGSVWLHAVSLGETRAAAALIEALRERLPGLRLLLTHGTATGREAGRTLLRDGDVQVWLPYDTPGAVRRFLTRFQPSLGVLMETEVWPNLLHAARAAAVPMVLANARLSAQSYARGRRLAALLYPAANTLALALAQTEDDAQRLRASGVASVQVCGNLKFDITPDAAQLAQGRVWREQIGRPVVMAAVTREGEEQALLDAWRRDVPAPRPLLLIAPRHPQRFDAVASLVQAAGLGVARRSLGATPHDASDVYLGDTLGEMALYYASADVALLGGSYAPLGGHNLIEAAACGCPLVMGPHTYNFAQAAQLSLAAGAALRVVDMREGVWLACELIHDGKRRDDLALHALAFAQAHRGAARRMAQYIVPLLGTRQRAITPPPYLANI